MWLTMRGLVYAYYMGNKGFWMNVESVGLTLILRETQQDETNCH